MKGEGNSYDYGARMLDVRVGRWFSTDLLEKKFPSLSTYNFVADNPINAIDPDGKDIIFVNGYRGGATGDASDREQSFQDKLRDTYWNKPNSGFTKEVERYFNDNTSHFVTGDHMWGSEANSRQVDGYVVGREMVNSGEIKVSIENNIMTVVMHSQGNAEGVGIAQGIIDAAKDKGITVKVNLVFLSVHQPNDIRLTDDLRKRGIQFTYANDDASVLQPMAKQEGSEKGLSGVIDANPNNIKYKKGGTTAHSATIDDNEAFNAIKKTDQKEKIFIGRPKKK